MPIHLPPLGTSHSPGIGRGPARDPSDGGSSLRLCPSSCSPRLSPTEPRRASRSQVRAWSWRRYSLASCLAALKASACRAAASVRSANWDRGPCVPWDGTKGRNVFWWHTVWEHSPALPQGHGPEEKHPWHKWGQQRSQTAHTTENHPTPGDQPQPWDGDTPGGTARPSIWGATSSHLGLVPLLGLLDVAGSHGLVLAADVAQGGRQVRLARVHLDVHPLPGQLLLQLPQLLWGLGGQGNPLSPSTPRPRARLPPRGPCGGRRSRPAGSPRAAPGPGEPRQHCPHPVTVGGQEGLSQLATQVSSPLSCRVVSIPSCSHPALPLCPS